MPTCTTSWFLERICCSATTASVAVAVRAFGSAPLDVCRHLGHSDVPSNIVMAEGQRKVKAVALRRTEMNHVADGDLNSWSGRRLHHERAVFLDGNGDADKVATGALDAHTLPKGR